MFDDSKHRWDEFKARTVNMACRAGHNDREIALALHDVLPGDAVVYLDQRGVSSMNLDMLWHLDLLYRMRTLDSEMAQMALETVTRGEHEPAYRFGKRVIMLASAATVQGENLVLKAQRAFVAGINCWVMAPKLRYARHDTECTMEKFLEVAEQAEVHYQLKREDPTDNKVAPTKVVGTSPAKPRSL
eukprot:GHVT01077418.1.p1 GENE.GHVT01077418.1~~GHVT01077418.1.p1  ORF type:complete len:187 (+),score=4.57 GHVT01077418.1:415-975(+)